MKKKTHDEYVKELKIKNPNVEVIETYINASTKIKHKCLIDGYEWYSTPNNILCGCGCPKCSGNAKKTHEEYVKEVKSLNPNIEVAGMYKNAQTKILHRCLIDGYEWFQKPNNILNGNGCPCCAGNMKKTQEEYIKEVAKINPNVEVIGTYVDAKTPIKHKCKNKDCGNIWETSPGSILSGSGCPICSMRTMGVKKRKLNSQFKEELKHAKPYIISLEPYVTSHTPIRFKCLIDGYEWETTPSNVLYSTGCPKCANNIKKTTDEYKKQVSSTNSYILVVGDYVNAKTPIKHKCLIHDYIWDASPDNILNGAGCPMCNESCGERKVRLWLESHNINYEFQKRFNDCCDINPLPFDFYLPEYNTIIEYDGGQHYHPVDLFGGVDGYKTTIKHDNIKNNYCVNKGITLLRIPYYSNIEKELNNFIN